MQKDNLIAELVATPKVTNDPTIYFTNDKGKIAKNSQPMAVNKTARPELINKQSTRTPAPGHYPTPNAISSSKLPLKIYDPRDNAYQKIRA